MRGLIRGIRNLIVEDTEFAVILLATLAMAVGYQLVVGPSAPIMLSLLALFLCTAWAEMRSP